MDTISPVYARLMLRELERRRIDSAPLFAGRPLNRDELIRGGDISMADFLHILRTGGHLMGDEQLGFMLGRNMHVFALGPVGMAMAVAPSLREGVQILETFTRLHASYVDISARSTMPGLTVTIRYQQDTGDVERFHTETAMILLRQYMETLIGEPVKNAQFRLAIPSPKNIEDYRNALHGAVSFDTGANQVDIPHQWLDLPSPYYHSELWRQAQLELSQRLKEQSERAGTPYTQHIAALLGSGELPLPELGNVARDLHVSERTLNRRLRAENTSFRELKSHALASRAKLYLSHTKHSVEAISVALGYKDAANFRRAFRNSEGCSPIEYRHSMSVER